MNKQNVNKLKRIRSLSTQRENLINKLRDLKEKSKNFYIVVYSRVDGFGRNIITDPNDEFLNNKIYVMLESYWNNKLEKIETKLLKEI